MPDHSRRVIEAIGSGDRTHANIAAAAGTHLGPVRMRLPSAAGGIASSIFFAGSIKWLETPFDAGHLRDLTINAVRVPGFTPESSGLVVVSASGLASNVDPAAIDLVWSPRDVVAAWALG